MNRIYRLVFNASLNTFVVTSEFARGRGKGSTVLRAATAGAPFLGASARRTPGGTLRLGLLASLLAAQFVPTAALAHTTSIGYENSGLNALTFWYGTYHSTSEQPYNEGSMRLTGPNGFDNTLPYDLFAETKPTGLVDGATNFYSYYGYGLMPYDVGSPPQNWQGLRFTSLRPGTYTFTYVPIANPTQKWAPINDAILSNSVTVITADLDNQTDRISTGETVDQGQVSDPIIFDGGTLKLTQPATFGQVVSVNDPGGTIDTNGNSATLTGDIDGRGVLTKTGEGTLYLRGTNTSTGGLALNGGTVNIDSDARLGASAGGLSFDGGRLQFDGEFDLDASRSIRLNAGGGVLDTQSHTTTISLGITGTGALTKTGTGSLTLGGANSYTGATEISAGTLALTVAGSIASSSGVISNGTLDISGTNAGASITTLSGTGSVALGAKDLALTNASGTFAGTIAGTGGLGIVGGTETLTGANTYTGATTIANGAGLALTGAGSIAGSSGIANQGTLDISGTHAGAALTSLSGTGSVALGSQDLTLTNATGIFAGTIAGTGGLNLSGGTATLAGVNTYTGATTIANGASLALTGAGSIAASSGIANQGTLDISGTHAGAALTSLSGTGSVALGSQDLTLTNATGIFAGTIAGTGGLNIHGGTTTLTGASTYTGGTRVRNASVNVASDQNLGAAAGALSLDNATLQATASFDSARAITLNGTGSFAIDDGVVLRSTGALAGGGALVKDGAGVLVLDGTASHTGGTVVNGGTLALGGENTYTGGNTVNAGGTLQVGKDAALGAAANGVTLNGGTLQTTDSFVTTRPVDLAGDSSISTADGTTLTASGQFSGTGRLAKRGAGTLVLTGDNLGWSGGTIIDAGVVRVTSATGIGTGDVMLNGGMIETTVTLPTGQQINVGGNTGMRTAANTTTTLSGDIASAVGAGGCFVKSGAGTLNLTGSATLRNGTCVQEGVLKANGMLDSAVAVDAAGTLRGTGRITGHVTVNGTLAPGNSPGTLTTTATVTMAPGSNLQVDMNGLGTGSGPGNYSRLLVTGAGSQYVIDGATLSPNLVAIAGPETYTPYVPKLGDNFRLVTAEGGIVGRFAPLVQPQGLADGTRMTAFYDVLGANSVDLRVVPVSYTTLLAATAQRNARSAATALDRVMAANDQGTASGAQATLAYAVAGATADQLPGLATALAGEVHGALAAAAPLAGQSLQQAVTKRLAESPAAQAAQQAEGASGQALWVDVSGQRGRWRADGNASSFKAGGSQLTVGADLIAHANRRVGVGVSHAQTDVDARGGSGSVRQDLLFVYGEQALGRAKLDLMGGLGRSSWRSERSDPLQGTAVLRGHAKGEEVLVGAGLRAPWKVRETTLEPFARVLWQQSRRDAFQESGDSPAALQVSRYSATGLRSLVGVSGGAQAADPLAQRSTLRYSTAVGYDGGRLARSTVSASLGGADLGVVTPDVGRAFVQASVSGTWRTGQQAYLYYGLSGELRHGRTDLSVTGGLRVRF